MLLVKTGPKREESAVETSSQDNQLFPTLEGHDTKVSTLNHRRPSRDGSPEAKRARMGSVKQLVSCSQSVAERIKESTLKLQELSTQNGNSVAEVKTPFSVFTGRKDLNDSQLNTVRVIAQHLKELGLREAVNALVEETGCKIEHTHAAHLRKAVKAGSWNEALAVLERSQQFISEDQYELVRCELIIQKVLDLLRENEVVKVVQILREELPRYAGNHELEQLYRLIYMSPEELSMTDVMYYRSEPDYNQKVARTIEKLMPSSFMLQESRLDQLLNKALLQQVSDCSYHLADRSQQDLPADSILMDHTCALRPDANFHSPQIINDEGEVFCSEFSPNGKYLITASMSNRIRLHKVSKKTWRLNFIREMSHKSARKVSMVNAVSWSFDSKYVAICGGIRTPFEVSVFEIETGKTHRILKKSDQYDFSCCAFLWKSYDLAVADENGHFQIHDVSEPYDNISNPLVQWEGYRIKKLRPLRSGGILALDGHNRLRKYTYRQFKSDRTVAKDSLPCNNFSVHKSEKYALLSTDSNLRLWDITCKSLVRTYASGLSRGKVIESAFGGPNDEYIAAGTPIGKILIYNINDTFPILEMKGHLSSINSLNWHPKAKGMFVSSSAERLRVWHVGCGLDSCNVGPVRDEEAELLQYRAFKKSQRALEKQIQQERRLNRKQKKGNEAVENGESQENAVVEINVPSASNGEATEVLQEPAQEKQNKKKKHRRRVKSERNVDGMHSIFQQFFGEAEEGSKKSRRKSKRRNNLGVLSLSMEVDDSANGKAAASGDPSENSSVRSQL